MRTCARLGCGILLAFWACGPAARAADPVLAAFQAPPAAARPMLRWWWPGNDVSAAGLGDELGAARAAGFGGVEIQAFTAGLSAARAGSGAVQGFATPAFFAHVAAAVHAAAAQGMAVDLTFGSGWPTGGQTITPALGMVEMQQAAITLVGPMHFHGPVAAPPQPLPSPIERIMQRPANQALPPEWQARLAAGRHWLAVLAVRGTAPRFAPPGPPNGFLGVPPPDVAESGRIDPGSVIDLTRALGADGTLDWQVPAGTWQVIGFVAQPTGQRVLLSAGPGPQLVLDHFNADAIAAQARLFAAGRIGRLGLRNLFVDSFELTPANYWARDFMAQFRAMRGYDLTPDLPLVLDPYWMDPYRAEASHPLYEDGGSLGARVREDYHQTVSTLMRQRFFAPLVAFGHAEGLGVRFQAHGAPVDLVSTYGMADIPETEDLALGPAPDFLSLARSAADIYGHRIVSAESMILVGHALDATPEMLKARADRFFISGVNRLVFHGMPYPYLPDAGLGWSPFGAMVGNDFDPANPIFKDLGPLTAYLARIEAVGQATRPDARVALYRDLVFRHAKVDLAAPAIENPVFRTLRRGGYVVDTLSEDGLLRSHLAGGRLVTPGGAAYQALVLADLPSLDRAAADRLAALAAGGVKLVFLGAPPPRARGLRDAARTDAAVARDVARILAAGGIVRADAQAAAALDAVGVGPNLRFLAGARPDFIDRVAGGRHYLFIANPTAQPIESLLGLPYGGAIRSWDGWTGAQTPLGAVADGTGMRFTLRLGPHGSALLAVYPGRIGAVAAAPPPTETALPPPGRDGWQFSALGWNHQGAAVRLVRDRVALADWRAMPGLGAFSGTARYATTLGRLRGRVVLRLGVVHDAAVVTLNGCHATLVMPPYDVDLTPALARPGDGRLAVEVASTAQNGDAGRSLGGFFPAGGTEPAGWIGPVGLARRSGGVDPALPALACPAL